MCSLYYPQHISHKQQEESFQVIGQMRRITSSVWLTHGPRPFREVQTRPRTLSNWEVVSAPSFSFCCQLCLHFWPPSLLSWWWYRSAPFWFFCSRILICKRMNYTITHTSLDRPWSNIILQYTNTSTLQKYKRCVLGYDRKAFFHFGQNRNQPKEPFFFLAETDT